jgi:hypothetical protein
LDTFGGESVSVPVVDGSISSRISDFGGALRLAARRIHPAPADRSGLIDHERRKDRA